MENATSNANTLLEIFNEIAQKNQRILKNLFHQQEDNIELSLKNLLEIYQTLTEKILHRPDVVIQSQFAYCQEYLEICRNFNHQNLSDHNHLVLFDFIKKIHSLTAEFAKSFLRNLCDSHDGELLKKLEFFTNQFINAISPDNFVHINPDILQTTNEMQGENLYKGFTQFLNDLEKSNGLLNIPATDLDFFKLGENIATTQGKVIYQNDLMQLIHYNPLAENIYQYPLLIIPPWINKYYILDLQPENSFVKWLLEQGFNVFLISWVNPGEQHAHKQFFDYMLEGSLAALTVIEQQLGKQKKINTLGYCIGGTLLACTLAYLTAGKDQRINSASYLTTLLDFSEPGELGVFIDEEQIASLEKFMRKKGYMDGTMMATTFNLLRPNDLIWSNFIHNYLKGEKPKPFDLLFWNSDSTNIPEKVHSFYLREMYLHNHLIQPGKIAFANTPLDISKIQLPSYFLAAINDHIVPWTSCYKSMQHLTGPKKFVLAKSGHVAGVVNPPHRQKYGYFTYEQTSSDSNDWLSNAQFNEGSWWGDFAEWLKTYSGEKYPTENLLNTLIPAIEDAPGSYVRRKTRPSWR